MHNSVAYVCRSESPPPPTPAKWLPPAGVHGGQLTLLQLATSKKVILVDILKLGEAAFDAGGLRSFLQNPELPKVMFDCRNDAGALHRQHSCLPMAALDMQLLDIMLRNRKESQDARIARLHPYLPRHVVKLRSLTRSVQCSFTLLLALYARSKCLIQFAKYSCLFLS